MRTTAGYTIGGGTGVRGAGHALGALRNARRVIAVAALLALGGLWAAPLSARELRIRNFHADLDVMPDSSLDVTETIGVEFIGSWQGMYRTIPVEYAGPGGFNYSLFITDVTASDGAGGGAALRIDKSRSGPNLQFKIYVPDAVDTTRSITLHYRV